MPGFLEILSKERRVEERRKGEKGGNKGEREETNIDLNFRVP